MDITPLDIELVRQKPGSEDCLRCCAYMILKYFDNTIKKNYVWDNLHIYRKHSGLSGGYITDFGKLAINEGYSSTIQHYATHWWDEAVITASRKSKKALISALKDLKKQKSNWPEKKEVEKEIQYVAAGGKYKTKLPELTDIDFHISRGVPVILNILGDSLYKTPGENYTHSIVVVGKKENQYFLKDPYLALNKINENELIYAWARSGGWMITIKPKKEKVQVEQTSLNF